MSNPDKKQILPPIKEYYKPEEVAALLSIGRHSVMYLIRSGRLIASNISRGEKHALYRITRKEIDRFLTNSQNYGSRTPKNKESE